MDIKIEPDDDFVPTNAEETGIHGDLHDDYINGVRNKEHSVDIKYEVPVKQECIFNDEDHQNLEMDISKESQKIKSEEEEKTEYKICENIKIEKFETDSGECSYMHQKPNKFPTTNCDYSTTVELPSTPSSKNEFQFTNKQRIKREILECEEVPVIELENGVFHERNFVCSVCFAIFPLSRLLRQHASLHVQERIDTKKKVTKLTSKPKKAFKCSQCSFGSSYLSSLQRHKARRICDKTNKSVPSTKLVQIDQKTFKCEQCPFQSTYLSSFRTHKITHSGEKPFKCDVCNFESAYSCHLKTHKMSHTGEKPFKCDICGLKFAQLSNLKTHKKSHSGEQPYECDLCDFKSAYSSYLKKHKMLHTGEKQFKCDQCNFETAYINTFRKHKVAKEEKEDEKLFQCVECDFKSDYSCLLQKHKITHADVELFHYD